jgi:uridine kinase
MNKYNVFNNNYYADIIKKLKSKRKITTPIINYPNNTNNVFNDTLTLNNNTFISSIIYNQLNNFNNTSEIVKYW